MTAKAYDSSNPKERRFRNLALKKAQLIEKRLESY
jgi:hypothetical protein